MPFKKGEGGRPKGVTNKATAELKDMILGALDDVGGREYLARQAEANPGAFMTLVGKVLPTTLAGDKDNPIKYERIERVIFEGDIAHTNGAGISTTH